MSREYNDIYDRNRCLTGRVHLRGSKWGHGEYGLVAAVWIYDCQGRILMTRRAREKSFAGTWENTGGAVKAGESSLQAIVRELREETGLVAGAEEFELLSSDFDGTSFLDHYCLCRNVELEQVVLQPGETDGAKWVTFAQIHEMIRKGQICHVIAQQFLRHEAILREKAEESGNCQK